ncbi:MAG: UbiH/UbiF/VisC/COQ6 family ubiquinone biosynthesis hydroxylase [Pseudomonadota bacterium]
MMQDAHSTQASDSITQFDVVISGGGIAGYMMALELSASSFRVALLDAQGVSQVADHVIADVHDVMPRVSALTLASMERVKRLGAWEQLNLERVCLYQDMHVWDAQGNARVEFSAEEVACEQLGCIIENQELIAALQRQTAQSDITVYQETMLNEIQRDELAHRWTLLLSNGEQVSCALLIGADGAQSFVRTSQLMKTRQWAYQQHALVAVVDTEIAHGDIARQRFLASGPLAFLPLASEQQSLSSIVWSSTPEHINELIGLDDDAFMHELELAFELTLGRVVSVSKRYCFPLTQCHAIDYVDEGLALVADAAHAIHPLAGQGINLGIQDVRVLAEEIMRAKRKSSSWYAHDTLLRYQSRRKVHNLGMMAVVEGFSRLYENENLSVSFIRNAGMRWFSKQPTVKKHLIQRAMGLTL